VRAKQLSMLYLLSRRKTLAALPLLVVTGRPEDADALAGAPDGDALRVVGALLACATVYLATSVPGGSLPVPNSLFFFFEHRLHLAKVQGLQL